MKWIDDIELIKGIDCIENLHICIEYRNTTRYQNFASITILGYIDDRTSTT